MITDNNEIKIHFEFMDVLVSEYESVFPEDGCKSGLYRKQYNLWSIHCQSRSKLLSGTTASLFR